MSTDQQLQTFLSHDNTTSHTGQQRAGTWQAGAGEPLTGQRTWESFNAYAAREAAYKAAKETSNF